MLVLGIETSCDETALALVADGRRILGTQVASSLRAHQRYGGVVPEIASRAHVEIFTYELEALLAACRIQPNQIDRIAVTHGPGLSGSLLVGVAAAKVLALAWRKPLVGVNHLQAHLYAALMEHPDCALDDSRVGLVISGGHTALVRMDGIRRYRLLGQTRDDAVGEAFDKVAKLLGLGFPGGPEIERTAQNGNPKKYRFSPPQMKSGARYDFSFSGVKTAVLYQVREEMRRRPVVLRQACPEQSRGTQHERDAAHLSPEFVADVAASFQASIVEEVVMKSVAAASGARVGQLVVGGGVVANRSLRQRLATVCADLKIQLAVPSMNLCTDNGAMIGGFGFHCDPDAAKVLTAIPDLRVELN